MARRQGPTDPRDPPPPPPSPPRPKVVRLPPNWKTAKDSTGKVYYYHTVTRYHIFQTIHCSFLKTVKFLSSQYTCCTNLHYSEVLPATANEKKVKQFVEHRQITRRWQTQPQRKPIPSWGPTIEKACRCLTEEWVRGTKIRTELRISSWFTFLCMHSE